MYFYVDDKPNGIAEGANRSFEEIFLLNARSEILFNPDVLANECTSLVALPECTANGDTLLAQNWDWYQEVLNCQVILKIGKRNDVPPLISFTEAGQLAKIGMNGAGIGLAVNNLTSDQPRTGVPWIFLARRILESTHFAQAMGYVLTAPRAHSFNFLLAHAAGEGVDLGASVVDIVFPLDLKTCRRQHAGQGIADDSVADRADVEGSGGVGAHELDLATLPATKPQVAKVLPGVQDDLDLGSQPGRV